MLISAVEAFAMTDEGQGSVAATSGLARRLCALALLAASGGLLASACASNESSLFIRMRMAPTEDCTVACGPGEEFMTEDSVDAAFNLSHSATLLVGNQIVQRGDSDVLRTETSRVQLYEAEVRVADLAGNPVTEGYVVPITGLVDPGTGDDPGYNCTQVLLIDGATMDSLGRRSAELGRRDIEVVATVVVRGRTLGGQEVETAEWSYPVRVCFDCSPCVTHPENCCTGSTEKVCQELDEIERTCSGRRGPIDCRDLGTTCEAYKARRL
ncbi:hypothetical protein [Sorangium sp. So ce362]|uniref:hypothetical protein n=1 Tax=Sorangium sp. So ce362 TaxID=3133303 RepID=UPI003F5DB55F